MQVNLYPFSKYFPFEFRRVCKAWRHLFERDSTYFPRLAAFRNLQAKKFTQMVTPLYPLEKTWNHMQFFPYYQDGLAVELLVFVADKIAFKYFDFPLNETQTVALSDLMPSYCNPFMPEQSYTLDGFVKTVVYRDTLYKAKSTGIQLFRCDKKKGQLGLYTYTEGEKLPQEFKCPGLLDFIVLPNFLIASVNGVIKVYDLTTFKHLYDIDDKHYTYLGAAKKGARLHAHSREGWVLLDFGVTPLPKTHKHIDRTYL